MPLSDVLKPFYWQKGQLKLLDQRLLPLKEDWKILRNYQEVAKAIKEMIVRGAPAIGCVAAYGFVLGVKYNGENWEKVYHTLKNTRPTAVNLFNVLEEMKEAFLRKEDIEKKAKEIEERELIACKKMGEEGNKLIPYKAKILTHCNTGALATAGWGTALGVIRSAHYSGKNIFVWVDETRPYLQGARLTAWELVKEKIPHKIITDNSAGFLMQRREVDLVIVGADTITLNGDVANKIGTYTLAILAQFHKIPFYVVAPTSSFNFHLEKGEEIIIEKRDEQEVKQCGGCPVAPKESPAENYSFDITPASLITAIITEKGVIEKPNREKIEKFLKNL